MTFLNTSSLCCLSGPSDYSWCTITMRYNCMLFHNRLVSCDEDDKWEKKTTSVSDLSLYASNWLTSSPSSSSSSLIHLFLMGVPPWWLPQAGAGGLSPAGFQSDNLQWTFYISKCPAGLASPPPPLPLCIHWPAEICMWLWVNPPPPPQAVSCRRPNRWPRPFSAALSILQDRTPSFLLLPLLRLPRWGFKRAAAPPGWEGFRRRRW